VKELLPEERIRKRRVWGAKPPEFNKRRRI